MKAIVYERYGTPDVLEMRELATPVPRPDEVLIRVYATTVTTGDWRARSLHMPAGLGWIGRLVFGIFKPRQPILGTELAGKVESTGSAVTRFKAGDAVVAFSGAKMGCHAEYRAVSEHGVLVHKPSNITYSQAAALGFGGLTALSFLRRAKLRAGERVLINGASGGVGSAAVQIARHLGAHVTAVCSTRNLALVKSLGAEHAIDYTSHDFAANGETYDVIIDTVGTAGYARSKGSLAPHGRLLLVVGGLLDMFRAPWVALTSTHRLVAGPSATRVEDLETLARLAAEGEYTPVIGMRYAFEQMAAAHAHVDTGHKQGSVVVTLGAIE